MAVSTSEFPQCLQIPTITNNRKHLTWLFPFLTETSTLLKREQLPYQPTVCTKLQHMLISQIWQWRKMHDAALSISACCRRTKRQSLYNPKSSHAMREHHWVALTSFWLQAVCSKLRDLSWMQHLTEVPESLISAAVQWRGLDPYLCLWGNWGMLSMHTQGLGGHQTELSNLVHHLHSGKAFSDL